ncbi:MAG: hypothetical protein H7834_12515, partial [Magnetococcus sp. YQC-9]
MNELTTTQQTILEAAINHLNGSIHPLPGNLKGGAEKKVIRSMLKNGLIEEAGVETWRISEAGFLAIGLMPPQPQVETTTDIQVEIVSTTHDDPELEADLANAEQAMSEMAKAFEDKPADAVADDPSTTEQQAAEDEPAAEQQAAEDEPTTEEDEEPTPSNLQIIIGVAQSFGVESETFANVFNGMLGRAFQHG